MHLLDAGHLLPVSAPVSSESLHYCTGQLQHCLLGDAGIGVPSVRVSEGM